MKTISILSLLAFAVYISFPEIIQASASCEIKRQALYDVGSGSTKLTVVETNSCEKIPKLLLNTSEKVDYKDDLIKSKNSEFSNSIQENGLAALKKLKAQAVKLNSDEHRGIATAAFREAKNSSDLIQKFKQQLNINIVVITQEKEGQLAYQAVKLYNPEKNLLVWDIGGASFQLTFFDEAKNEWKVFKGTLASVVFKDLILTKVKKDKNLLSPNPLTQSEIKKARTLVNKELSQDFKKSFLSKNTFNKVVGMGGVFALSLKRYLNKSVISTEDLDLWIQANQSKTDADFNDKYAATVVSNMILVSEMMKILNIKKVEVADVTLVEGLLNESK